MINAERARVLASSLAIGAQGPDARYIVGQVFGVPSDAIDLTYPSTSEQER
jgi:hypothetical protein